MSTALINVLTSSADFAVNSAIAPRYSKTDTRLRSPATPAPIAFSIWTPIFAGRIAYGFLNHKERSQSSTAWNHALAASGLVYADALTKKRFYRMQAAMAAMTVASYKYRANLPVPKSKSARAVAFAAELGLGWIVAADMVIGAKNHQRLMGREYSHLEQDAVGIFEAAAIAGTAVIANRRNGWTGVSVAAAWALANVAADHRSEKHVRGLAAVAAIGVIADAVSVMSARRVRT